MSASEQANRATWGARLVPVGVVIALLLLSGWIWRLQVQNQRELLTGHTQDVCIQAARRIQILVESRLQLAAIFARRWASSEQQAPSRERFVQLARLLVEELPGYHAVRLVLPGGDEWIYPPQVRSAWPELGPARQGLLQQAARQRGTVLSAPVAGPTGSTFFAVLPLGADEESRGQLVVELSSNALIGEGFEHRIRAEFRLQVRDARVTLFRFQDDVDSYLSTAPIVARHTFALRNRSWEVAVAPRLARVQQGERQAGLPVLLLGVPLSLGLGLLIHLLARRMELYRLARDRALQEMAQREEAQQALRVSESRYRSVFDSATDGLLLLHPDGRIIEANPAACTMHGYSPGQLTGRNVTELIDASHQHLFEEFQRQLKSFASARLDSTDRRQGGETIDVEVRGTQLRYEGKTHMLAILTDVSERKLAVKRHAMLSRKVLMAQEEERARVSRELHDELGQMLTAIHLELDWLAKKLGQLGEEQTQALRNTIGMVENAADELRHICRGLRPQLLDDLGLEPAVRTLVEEFQERTRLATDLEIQLDESERPLPQEVSLAIYRVLQETLHNISRHAAAREVSISLYSTDAELVLSVYDDGKGFDLGGLEGSKGCGIAGMRERAHLIEGILDLRSEPFQGTRVALRVPLKRPAREEDHDQDTHRG